MPPDGIPGTDIWLSIPLAGKTCNFWPKRYTKRKAKKRCGPCLSSKKESILKKANGEVLKAHLEHCVKEAVTNHDATEKLLEIETIIAKLL